MSPHPWLGSPVYVRTLGEVWIGRLAEVTPLELVLSEATWVADSGRLSLTLGYGVFRATEPTADSARDCERAPHPVRIGRGHVVSWTLFADDGGQPHRLPDASGVYE